MNRTPSVSIPPWAKRVICWVFSPKGGLIILLGVLFVGFVAVMVSQVAEGVIGQLLGLSGTEGIKNQILTFLGLSMGGVLLVMQTIIANTRAEAMEKAVLEQAKANENAEKGQRQERLKNAIEHLGHDSMSIRLGGAYELFHLAQDTKQLRQTILDILCAHVRQTTSESRYKERYRLKPSEEIQSLLTLMFVQDDEQNTFKSLHIDLQGSWLNGVKLGMARLEKASVAGTHLRKAELYGAELQNADFSDTRLQGALLSEAQLQGANLNRAEMQGVDLFHAQLQGATLFNAQLQGASLFEADLQMTQLGNVKLQGSDLIFARLQGADLFRAQFQGADLSEAEFQEATLNKLNLRGVTSQSDGSESFETRINDRIGEQSDLNGVKFAGGLTQVDVDYLVESLADRTSKKLREKLNNHAGKPESNILPDSSGAITGSYTKEEAEQWIAEYKKAMSEDWEGENS